MDERAAMVLRARFSSHLAPLFCGGVAVALVALSSRDAGACSPPCSAPTPVTIDPDVPTDIGLHLNPGQAGGLGPDLPPITAVKVTDAGGATVAGKLVGGDWTPDAPLAPNASYTLTEVIAIADGRTPRALPFVAGPGPAPALTSVKLTYEVADILVSEGSVCCGGADLGGCGQGGPCASTKHRVVHTARLRYDGVDPRWFQRVELPNGQLQPIDVGEVCHPVTLVHGQQSAAPRSVCATFAATAAPPATCPDVLSLLKGCGKPDAALTAAAKACESAGMAGSGGGGGAPAGAGGASAGTGGQGPAAGAGGTAGANPPVTASPGDEGSCAMAGAPGSSPGTAALFGLVLAVASAATRRAGAGHRQRG